MFSPPKTVALGAPSGTGRGVVPQAPGTLLRAESTTVPNAGWSRKRPSSSLCIGKEMPLMLGGTCAVLVDGLDSLNVAYCADTGGDCACPLVGDSVVGGEPHAAEAAVDPSGCFLGSKAAAWHLSRGTFPTVANSHRISLKAQRPCERCNQPCVQCSLTIHAPRCAS